MNECKYLETSARESKEHVVSALIFVGAIVLVFIMLAVEVAVLRHQRRWAMELERVQQQSSQTVIAQSEQTTSQRQTAVEAVSP